MPISAGPIDVSRGEHQIAGADVFAGFPHAGAGRDLAEHAHHPVGLLGDLDLHHRVGAWRERGARHDLGRRARLYTPPGPDTRRYGIGETQIDRSLA